MRIWGYDGLKLMEQYVTDVLRKTDPLVIVPTLPIWNKYIVRGFSKGLYFSKKHNIKTYQNKNKKISH